LANYQRSVDKDVADHLKHTAEVVFLHMKDAMPKGILVGGPVEAVSRFEALLHNDVKKCLKGRFDSEVWNSSADDVLKTARGVLEELAVARDGELLDKIDEGLATGGRAVAGLNDVLPAVHERRIDMQDIGSGRFQPGEIELAAAE